MYAHDEPQRCILHLDMESHFVAVPHAIQSFLVQKMAMPQEAEIKKHAFHLSIEQVLSSMQHEPLDPSSTSALSSLPPQFGSFWV